MQKNIKEVASRMAASLGYAIIPTWRLERWPLQCHLRTLFERYAVDTVLDVGANAGQYRDFLRSEVQFEGVIHSFEPLASLAQAMQVRARCDDRWHVHPFALGAREDLLELNVTASDVFSSFLEADVGGNPAFQAHTSQVRRESVRVRALDDVLPELGVDGPERLYLKVDTQGYDIEVLRGARHLLKSIKALQFELSIRGVYKGSPDYLSALGQLNEWGFEVSGLFPIVIDRNGQAIELDCVMVARSAVVL
jgi:FkbM family methyltransferase